VRAALLGPRAAHKAERVTLSSGRGQLELQLGHHLAGGTYALTCTYADGKRIISQREVVRVG